jgi:hypothetical protein
MKFPLKLAVPYLLFWMPFCYGAVTAKDGSPWVVGFGVYFLAAIVTYGRYEGFAYRVELRTIWFQYLVNAAIALTAVLAYGVLVSDDIEAIFQRR